MILLTACALLAIATGPAAAREGTIHGTVFDEKTGDKLTGANVLVTGAARGASTDLDGAFTIDGVPAGTYDVRVTCMGYNAKTVTGVVVKAGEKIELNIQLGAVGGEAFKIEDIVVSAERVLSTEAAVLAERRKSAIIGDAISAAQISRSPDATSGDALKRVTGLSVVDDKFVFIRGVTDRYNGTSLNGVSVSSTDTDADKKSFSFDLVPASLLSNTVVVKTATPDLPGDFSGGLVQVNTLEFPTERVIKLSLSQSYNDETSTQTMLASSGGDRDWLAMDDGSRELPGGLSGNPLARELPNTWSPEVRKAPMNSSFSLQAGDRFFIGRQEVGFIASALYKNKYQTSAFTEAPRYRGIPLFSFEGTRYSRNVMWGGLLNLNYKPHPRHKFSFKNSYIQTARENVSYSSGLPAEGEFTKRTTIEWEERNLSLTHIEGEHKIERLGDLEIDWNVFFSRSRAEEPDRRHVEFREGATGDWYAFRDNYRTWAELEEDSGGLETDLTMPVGDLKLKSGFRIERREREYGIEAWSTDQSTVRNPNYELLILPIEEVFAAENYGPDKFTFIPITVFTGEYDGEHDLTAGYLMVDWPAEILGREFRLAGGARVEKSDQQVHTIKSIDDPEPFTAQVDETDVLPSVNLTHRLGELTNIRLAYYSSVNRPEFREMANVLYYDFDRTQNVKGNPNLERATIQNYDARVEFFPNAGEVVAASYFYKRLHDAIEEKLIPTPERFLRTWFNSGKGWNHGFELEVRKSLGFIAGILENVSVTGNYTRVWSSIEYVETRTDELGNPIRETKTREMQGQSPWSVNVSLLWMKPSWGTSMNVLYNRIGRRLDAVGDYRDQDLYEESRDNIDLALSQQLFDDLKVKFTATNILGKTERYTSGPLDELHSEWSRGTTWSLSLSYDF